MNVKYDKKPIEAISALFWHNATDYNNNEFAGSPQTKQINRDLVNEQVSANSIVSVNAACGRNNGIHITLLWTVQPCIDILHYTPPINLQPVVSTLLHIVRYMYFPMGHGIF